jgi:hypothetical protein
MNEYRGLAIAIAGLIVVFTSILGSVLIVLSWVGITGYAGFKVVTGGSDDDPNVAGIIIGIVVLVTLLTLLMAVGIRFIGKGMEPRKRADREAERETVGL